MTMQERSLHADAALLADGWAERVRISFVNGVVTAVKRDAVPLPGDDRHAVLLPGLPNLHSHAFQRGMAGLAEKRGSSADSFWTWRATMYRFVDRIDPDDLRALAALAYVEMLESGFTRVGEFHYLHHDRDGGAYADPAEMTVAIVAAAADSGIALTHLPVFYAHAGFGGTAPGEGQRRFVHDMDGFGRLIEDSRRIAAILPDAIVGIAPHSLRAATPAELAALAALAGDMPVHIHIAEQVREVDDCLAWSGARPVAWLMDHAQVDARWCLVHATHVDAREVVQIARSGAVVGLCPITEANLGDGIFPLRAFLDANGRFGVGSDSNVLIDATEELRLLEYGQRLSLRARNIVDGRLLCGRGGSTGEALYRQALAGGQALGAPCEIALGGSADFVSLDVDHPALCARSGAALLDALVFAGGRGAIDGVWRRGEKLVSHGRHHARAAIVGRYRAVLRKLIA